MEVVGLRRNPSSEQSDGVATRMLGTEQLGELMSISDVLVIALPATKETANMINKEALSRAKKGQIIVNVGRGTVINEPDLVDCLKAGNIAGAALDVFAQEPLPQSSPLWELTNVLLSPHNADWTDDFRHKSVRYFCENCEKVIANEALDCIVNKQRGY